jgi:hypothetical protein
MTSHEQNIASLVREREARAAAYTAAVAERNALPAGADRFTARRAEARIELARTAMRHWGDLMPEVAIVSTAPEGDGPLSRPTGVVETAEATAARILASDTVPGEGRKDAEVDAIARRIAAA